MRDDIPAMRSEADVFSALATLCRSEGYVHSLAYLCFRDNILQYSEEVSSEDMQSMYSPSRLIRTELSTLIGLMIQGPIDWTIPDPNVVQQQLDQTEALLKELHETMFPSVGAAIAEQLRTPNDTFKLLSRGEFLREAIFYSSESAYTFQYRDFAPAKYGYDDPWLVANCGFSICEARRVVQEIAKLQETKLMETLVAMATLPAEQCSILPGYTFSAAEVSSASGLPHSTVEAVLGSFATAATATTNGSFRALDDFNVANSAPLLRRDSTFLLFQSYSLAEAVYESPFYWMLRDKSYVQTAMKNRGNFTETFCLDRLELVFGQDRVFRNVDLFESKARKIGEIDVLVVFGDRAIVVQTKSKRLTLESRKGNSGQIRDDFKKSVQDSYDQALLCAQRITDSKVRLVGPNNREISPPPIITEIFVLCVVSDHYPALHFQARQFLKYKETSVIQAPIVLDIFALDVITEMLQTPLRFLSYIKQRSRYTENLMASHETIVLAYHLKYNLWVKNDIDLVMLGDEFSADLDVAMAARREGLNGKRTPEGILTRLTSTVLGRIVASIESRPEPGIIDFGLLLLELSGQATVDISNDIARLCRLARLDGLTHDCSIGFESPGIGLTLHCSNEAKPIATKRLRRHCELKKYDQRAKTWLGICIQPNDESLRFGFKMEGEWRADKRIEDKLCSLQRSGPPLPSHQTVARAPRPGRNDTCFCGSGRKFKRCHGR